MLLLFSTFLHVLELVHILIKLHIFSVLHIKQFMLRLTIELNKISLSFKNKSHPQNLK